MSTLFEYQQAQKKRLTEIINEFGLAIDTSCTGSGKTITSIHTAKTFGLPILVICPPTLMKQWSDNLTSEGVEEHFVMSSCAISRKKIPFKDNFFLIVDEFHFFKNRSKRTDSLKTVLWHPSCLHSLFLSATPFDDDRQLSSMFTGFKDLSVLCSAMDFHYNHNMSYKLNHYELQGDDVSKYAKAYGLIKNAAKKRPDGTVIFRSQMYSRGVINIHDVLVRNMIEYLKHCYETQPMHKFVVVLMFKKDIDRVMNEFPSSLVINGDTKLQDRHELTAQFQEFNLNHRIVIIHPDVGGVGIELDDQNGSFPREVIALPTINAMVLVQVAGRVQRVHTKSNSALTVIQPRLNDTFFKSIIIKKKYQTLKTFCELPTFEELNKPE